MHGLRSTHPEDRARLRARHGGAPHVVAAFMCAAWCTACREFEPLAAALAEKLPEHSWVWIDIEDDAALVGDVDIETFPTVAVYVDGRLAHFGPVLPSPALVERLVGSAEPGPVAHAPEDIHALVRTLIA
jgi:thioredoxin reductase (NADPH)